MMVNFSRHDRFIAEAGFQFCLLSRLSWGALATVTVFSKDNVMVMIIIIIIIVIAIIVINGGFPIQLSLPMQTR